MKYLIILFAIALFSCSKPQPAVFASGENLCFYKITQVNHDGKRTSTPIKYISVGIDNSDGEDEEDEEDDDHCPLPIIFESFTLMLINTNVVRINWSATNEQDVDHYDVERSKDSKTWNSISSVSVSTDGNYSLNDKP
jgi:hypothetical protein